MVAYGGNAFGAAGEYLVIIWPLEKNGSKAEHSHRIQFYDAFKVLPPHAGVRGLDQLWQ